MNYENMSDFEINKRVAESLNPDAISIEYDWGNTEGRKKSKRGVIVVNGGPQAPFLFNPCNNPSDAWPIINENKIGGHWGKAAPGTYFAVSRLEDFVVMDKNPLRAAMIVYLMMQGAKCSDIQ